MTWACSTHGRPEYASANGVLVGDVKEEDHLADLGVERTILMTVAEAKADPVHETKAVAVGIQDSCILNVTGLDWLASRFDLFNTGGKSSDIQWRRAGGQPRIAQTLYSGYRISLPWVSVDYPPPYSAEVKESAVL